MSKDQVLAYAAALLALWPFAGVAVGAALVLLSGWRWRKVLLVVGVVLAAVSIGTLASRL